MTIRNSTRRRQLVSRHKSCDSVLCKARGLMFHAPIEDYGLVFDFYTPSRPALHNLFVFFPIDVLFVDEGFKVVELKEAFMPFSLHLRPKKPCRYVLELPMETIRTSGTRVGDKLVIGD